MTGKINKKIGRCVIAEKVSIKRSIKKFRLCDLRTFEIEKLIKSRHGKIIPNPIGTDDRDLCMTYVRAIALSGSKQDLSSWCRRWAPWVAEDEVSNIQQQSKGREHMLSADAVACLLRIPLEERDRLGLRTIGAADVSKEERNRLSRERKRAGDRKRQADKRKSERRKDRASYERESLTQTAPWTLEGISRRTWERRRAAGVASASRVGQLTEHNTSDRPASPSTASQHLSGFKKKRRRRRSRSFGVRGLSPLRSVREAEPHGIGDL